MTTKVDIDSTTKIESTEMVNVKVLNDGDKHEQ
jgi:hypothetical protein